MIEYFYSSEYSERTESILTSYFHSRFSVINKWIISISDSDERWSEKRETSYILWIIYNIWTKVRVEKNVYMNSFKQINYLFLSAVFALVWVSFNIWVKSVLSYLYFVSATISELCKYIIYLQKISNIFFKLWKSNILSDISYLYLLSVSDYLRKRQENVFLLIEYLFLCIIFSIVEHQRGNLLWLMSLNIMFFIWM